MTLTVIAALTGAAFVAGLIDAIAGGGGLITLPALLAAGLPPHLAIGTNKGQAVFGSGSALVAFWRRGVLTPAKATITFPLGLVGSLLGALALLAVPSSTLRPVVLVLLPLAALTLVVKKPTVARRPPPPPRRAAILAAGIAFVVGAYDGFFGPGTGTFLIIGFVLLLAEPLVTATADAKVVNFASNLAAVALFAWRGTVIWQIALPMAAAQLVGGQVGAHLAIRGGDRLVRAAVLVVTGALVVKLAWDLVRG